MSPVRAPVSQVSHKPFAYTALNNFAHKAFHSKTPSPSSAPPLIPPAHPCYAPPDKGPTHTSDRQRGSRSSFPRTREPKGRCPPRTCPIPVAFLRHPARVGVPPGPPAVPSAVPPQLRDGTEWGNLEHFFANSPVRAPFVIPVKHVPVKTGSGNPGAEGGSYGSPTGRIEMHREPPLPRHPQPLCHPAPLRV